MLTCTTNSDFREDFAPLTLVRVRYGNLSQKIADLDLSMVKRKIMDPEEGLGWDQTYTDWVEIRYRRFLTMTATFPDKSVVPTKPIDQLWHQHILDTRAYAADCENIFGKFLHHYPYFGMNGEDDAADLSRSFDETIVLYKDLFNEDYCSGPTDVTEAGSKCVKCGSGPVKCHHKPQPVRCR